MPLGMNYWSRARRATLGEREMRQGAAHVARWVARLQAPGQDALKGGARDHAELPGRGHRPGQAPAGDPGAHAALDDAGMGHGCFSFMGE